MALAVVEIQFLDTEATVANDEYKDDEHQGCSDDGALKLAGDCRKPDKPRGDDRQGDQIHRLPSDL